jgi:transposase
VDQWKVTASRPRDRSTIAADQLETAMGFLEGINNRIKVINHKAYGFRDDACFFVKIRAAFPGVGR